MYVSEMQRRLSNISVNSSVDKLKTSLTYCCFPGKDILNIAWAEEQSVLMELGSE